MSHSRLKSTADPSNRQSFSHISHLSLSLCAHSASQLTCKQACYRRTCCARGGGEGSHQSYVTKSSIKVRSRRRDADVTPIHAPDPLIRLYTRGFSPQSWFSQQTNRKRSVATSSAADTLLCTVDTIPKATFVRQWVPQILCGAGSSPTRFMNSWSGSTTGIDTSKLKQDCHAICQPLFALITLP